MLQYNIMAEKTLQMAVMLFNLQYEQLLQINII